MKHLLIVGRAGIGKTALIKRLAHALRGRAVDGFVMDELREGEERLGYWLSSLDGRQALLAHRQLDSPCRVGPYKVHVGVLDGMGVEILRRAKRQAQVILLDELGRMAASSEAFRQAVEQTLASRASVVATAGIHHVAWLEALKRRTDVEIVPLGTANWEAVREELTARLTVLCQEQEPIRTLLQQADRICEMIVSRETPEIDIEIQQAKLREAVAQHYPDHHALYHLLYESRFRRLWLQFRQA